MVVSHPDLGGILFHGTLRDRDACKGCAHLQLRPSIDCIYNHDCSKAVSKKRSTCGATKLKPITAELVDTLLSRAERLMRTYEDKVEQIKQLGTAGQSRYMRQIEPHRQDAIAAKFTAELAQHMYTAQQTVNPADLKG